MAYGFAVSAAAVPCIGDMPSPIREAIERAKLPDDDKASLYRTLGVFLNADEDERGAPDESERIVPKPWSLREMLELVQQHPDWQLPALSVDRDGIVTAVWERPRQSRWTLRFLKDNHIDWSFSKRTQEGRVI
ncbi:MAG TPA: hypothetical protein VFW46_16065, partial [Stellaceae bacterium]|nr:hypothetical protein [Stellaceae bacterium]